MDRSMPFIKSLPARLGDASEQALVSQIAKLYARKSKLAVISAGAAGHLAPVPDACRVAVTGNFRHLQARNQALGFIQAFVIRIAFSLAYLPAYFFTSFLRRSFLLMELSFAMT